MNPQDENVNGANQPGETVQPGVSQNQQSPNPQIDAQPNIEQNQPIPSVQVDTPPTVVTPTNTPSPEASQPDPLNTGINASVQPQAIAPEQIPPQQPTQQAPPPPPPTVSQPTTPPSSPLASGQQGPDYYQADTSKSPVLGIISLVLVITVIFAPIGFVLGIISIIKAKGKNPPLLIMGIISVLIGLITSFMSIIFFIGVMAGISGKTPADYTQVSQKTFESSGKKITIDVPKKYTVESDISDTEMKGTVYSNIKFDKDTSKSKTSGLDSIRIADSGGVMVAIPVATAASSFKFSPEDLKQAESAQPGFLNTIKDSLTQSFTKDLNSECKDKPDVSSEVIAPENKRIEITVKFSCEFKDGDVRGTMKMKLIMSGNGSMYIVGVIEKTDTFNKYSPEIDKLLNGAKLE